MTVERRCHGQNTTPIVSFQTLCGDIINYNCDILYTPSCTHHLVNISVIPKEMSNQSNSMNGTDTDAAQSRLVGLPKQHVGVSKRMNSLILSYIDTNGDPELRAQLALSPDDCTNSRY